MSSKSKKIPAEKLSEREKLRKKKKKKIKAIIACSIAAVVIACTVTALILVSRYQANANELYGVTWTPVSAKNASEDEVDVSEIYDVMYSNYQGSLTFEKDGTFRFWMAPGLPDDGTHSGTFEVDGDTIKACFDEGTQTEFFIDRDNGEIKTIQLGYNDYTVYFGKSANQ